MLGYSKLKILLILFSVIVSAKTLKIATYNVENLFDMQYSGLEYDEYIPSRHNWTEPILRKKLEHIAQVICDLDADVVGLEEVESDRVLARLQKVLGRVGCNYPYRAITNSKQTPVHVALLSKIAFKKHRDITIYRGGRQRSILEVDLKTDPQLKIFVNHWRSKAGPESERLPYAKALKRRLDALPANSEYIVMGDFNSDYDEYQIIDKKHNDTRGVTGINNILKTIKDAKMVRLSNLQNGYLCNLWMTLAPYQRWSHNFFGDKEALDSIIIPKSMYDGAGWSYKDDSFGVFEAKYLFADHGRVYRWAYRHGKHLGKGYSDHLPVYAIFETGTDIKNQNSKKGIWDKIIDIFSLGKKKPKVPEKIISTPPPKDEKNQQTDIEALYNLSKITKPLLLNHAVVIYKHKNSAIIKQSKNGRAMMLYRCAKDLSLGGVYDLQIYKKKRYKGVDELVDVSVVSQVKSIDTSSWIRELNYDIFDKKHISEVVKVNKAHYQNGKIKVGNRSYRIYFKRWAGRPANGVTIRIKRAIIGYYKNHNELVVWDRSDYEILE